MSHAHTTLLALLTHAKALNTHFTTFWHDVQSLLGSGNNYEPWVIQKYIIDRYIFLSTSMTQVYADCLVLLEIAEAEEHLKVEQDFDRFWAMCRLYVLPETAVDGVYADCEALMERVRAEEHVEVEVEFWRVRVRVGELVGRGAGGGVGEGLRGFGI